MKNYPKYECKEVIKNAVMQPHKSNGPCRKIPNDPNVLGPFRIAGFFATRE
jgi:hypothetical protein